MSHPVLPSIRSEAIRMGYTRYYTGKPCSRGHIAERHASGKCVQCNKEDIKKWKEANPDKYQKRNRENVSRWQKENRHKNNNNCRKWQKSNLHKHCAKQAKRRAAKINATPAWITDNQKQEINHIYETCPAGYHVDHIIPLRGEKVCGLHVPWNLQHIPADINLSKGSAILEDL